jgi:hypothetical protein
MWKTYAEIGCVNAPENENGVNFFLVSAILHYCNQIFAKWCSIFLHLILYNGTSCRLVKLTLFFFFLILNLTLQRQFLFKVLNFDMTKDSLFLISVEISTFNYSRCNSFNSISSFRA